MRNDNDITSASDDLLELHRGPGGGFGVKGTDSRPGRSRVRQIIRAIPRTQAGGNDVIAENVTDDGLEDVRMLNVADLSRCLKISVRQVHRMNRDALLPLPLRIGGCTRWRAAEVAAWLKGGSPPRERWNWQQATQTVSVENVNEATVS